MNLDSDGRVNHLGVTALDVVVDDDDDDDDSLTGS